MSIPTSFASLTNGFDNSFESVRVSFFVFLFIFVNGIDKIETEWKYIRMVIFKKCALIYYSMFKEATWQWLAWGAC